jgi:hypothetical protein
MTRTSLHHTLTALAAAALVSAFALSVSAEPQSFPILDDVPPIIKVNPKSKSHSVREPKRLTTQRRRPVACDCTNCSADHCQGSWVGFGFIHMSGVD